MPRRSLRGRVAAGVVRRQDRGGECYLRFRATVYEHQVLGHPKPARRTVATTRDVYRRSSTPHDWEASVLEAREERARVEAELLVELQAEHAIATRPATFGELADVYAADATDRGTRWDRERYRWAVLVDELGRDRPAVEVTPEWLQDWRQDLRRRRNLSARSVNAYTTLLRAICRLAVRTGRLGEDPTRHLRPYRETRGEVEWLTDEQLAAVLEAAARLQAAWSTAEERKGSRATPVYDLIAVAYGTAARTGNVLGLRWEEHVDWDAQAVVWQPGEVKNRRRVVVPMTRRLREVLLERWPGPGSAGFVFPSIEDPAQHVSNQAFRVAWREVLAAANAQLGAASRIPASFRLYNLRHTRATHVLAATGNPVIVAELLGDTVKMVLERYAGRDAEALRQALNRLDEVGPKAVPTRPDIGGRQASGSVQSQTPN